MMLTKLKLNICLILHESDNQSRRDFMQISSRGRAVSRQEKTQRRTSLNSWIWDCSNMENTLELDFCPPLCLLFEAFLLACENEQKLIQFTHWYFLSCGLHPNQVYKPNQIYTIRYNNMLPKLSAFFLNHLSLKVWKDWKLTDLPCLSDCMWTPSRGVMLGWALCMAHLILYLPIIIYGGQHSPLHGHGCSLCATKGTW